MSPRVTYWTGRWDPAKEAISKEVNALRTGSRARAPVVSFSPQQLPGFALRERVLRLSDRFWPALRVAAAIIEPRGDVTHIFGGQVSWHLFRALGRRPILLTAVVGQVADERLPHTKITRVAVESETAITEWLDVGIPHRHIEVIRPGVDLNWYRPTPPAALEPFVLLFASSPADPDEIETRGIPLLIELARLRPDVEVVVPWRQWGDTRAARLKLESFHVPGNFSVIAADAADMRVYYARAHATIVCFAQGVGKVCPNFVVEGLACGRPCIASPAVGIAELIGRTGAGVLTGRDIASMAEAVDRLRAEWAAYAARARRLAEEEFDVRRFRARYERLYREIASAPGAGSASATDD